MRWNNGIRDMEREQQAEAPGEVKTYKMSPEEMDAHFSRLNIKQSQNDKPTSLQAQKTIKEEEMMKNKTVENAKESLAHIQWFVDTAAPTTPVLRVNCLGILFNEPAIKELGCDVGQGVAVGLDPIANRLVVQPDHHGLELKQSKLKGKGLRIMNKRLGRWMKENQIEARRYPLKKDPALSVFYAELKKQG